jgi:hypothetical protein
MMTNGTYFEGERMTRRFKHASAISAVAVAIGALATVHPARVQAIGLVEMIGAKIKRATSK